MFARPVSKKSGFRAGMAKLKSAVQNAILHLFATAERKRFTTRMFGYITINKAELKFREFDVYQSYYCGLCRNLKQRYGIAGQATLTYDMTFLLLLLTGLYEPEETVSRCRCAVHPIRKHIVCFNPFTSYAADMNLMLSYYKCEDDWIDEHNLKKRAFRQLLTKGFHRIQQCYPDKIAAVETALSALLQYESEKESNIDRLAGCFGTLMSEIFIWQQDEWSELLKELSFYLGKFIYLVDAYEDIEEDRKKCLFNPLEPLSQTPEFESSCHTMLTMMMAECSKRFEQLPILNYASILRNILYSGVWQKYELIKSQRSGLQQGNTINKAGESK